MNPGKTLREVFSREADALVGGEGPNMDKELALVEAQDKLMGAHPDLRDKVTKVVEAMHALGFQVRVFEGERTLKRQQTLYTQGRTAPGKIVTRADGVHKMSQHQIQEDGYFHAADLVFTDESGGFSWDLRHPWSLLGAMGEALGLTWLGKIGDFPHLEV